MQFKKLHFLVVPLFSISIYAQATSSYLQDQINSLEDQINELRTHTTNWIPQVGIDTQAPFGYCLYTRYPLAVMQFKDEYHSPITLGTKLEMDAQAWGGSFSEQVNSDTVYQSGTDVDVTGLKMYTMAEINNWTTSFFDLHMAPSIPTRFEQAFLDLGNLQKNPFFLTVGEAYLPFGVFNGAAFWTDTLDIVTFRNNGANQVGLNFYQNGFYTDFNFFNENATGSSNIGDFVYNINYTSQGNFYYGLGAGYMYDIRGTSTGVGAAYPSNNGNSYTITGNRNAAFDLNGLLHYGLYGLYGQIDMTQNSAQNLNGSATGKMSAWNLTLDYTPTLWNIPTLFSLGYSATHNMNNIPMRLNGMVNLDLTTQTSDNNAGMSHQWLLFMSNEVFQNVYLTPEYAYSTLYNGTHTWSFSYDLTAYF